MSEREGLSRRSFLAASAAGTAALSVGRGVLGEDRPKPDLHSRPTAPLAMWALTGKLRSNDVCRQLDAYGAAGWGVVLYPRWGLELEYLGGAWFERIRFIVQQAAQRNLEVWLYDEFAWPSGQARGLVARDREDLAAELLHVDRDGTSRVARVPGTASLLVPEATQRFLKVTHQRYADALGELMGTTVRAIFTDEPSLPHQHRPRTHGAGSWQLPWSSALEAALDGDFRKRLAAAGDAAAWSGLSAVLVHLHPTTGPPTPASFTMPGWPPSHAGARPTGSR